MARKKHRDNLPATTATALRLMECVFEKRTPESERAEGPRAFGSWFEAVSCTKAFGSWAKAPVAAMAKEMTAATFMSAWG